MKSENKELPGHQYIILSPSVPVSSVSVSMVRETRWCGCAPQLLVDSGTIQKAGVYKLAPEILREINKAQLEISSLILLAFIL